MSVISGSAVLNKFTSVDAAAIFSADTAPEFCAGALPLRRMPNARTRASSITLAKVNPARQNHPGGRWNGCDSRVGGTIVGPTIVGRTIVGRIATCSLVEFSPAL